VLATAARITDGDQASWHREWVATAARVAALGERSLAAGHRLTARENLLRASNYYRNAAAFGFDNPAARYAAQIDTFAASALFDHPAEAVTNLARAAAVEHRLCALILNDGVHDLASGFADHMPPFLTDWVQEGHDEYAIPVLTLLMSISPQLAWAVRNGMWVFGVKNYAELLRTAANYTLDGVADQIVAPTLIMEGEHDTLLQGQPERVEKALTAAKTTRVP
jgi:hypothetical protein